MSEPMQFEVRLVHADGSGRRVVVVRARQGDSWLGSAIGEADHAEEAEERALGRLLERLKGKEPRQPMSGTGPIASRQNPASASPPATTDLGPEAPAASERIDAAAASGGPPAASPKSPGPSLPLEPPLSSAARPADPKPTPASPLPRAAAPSAPAAKPESMVEPPADPEDWSSELARLDLALRRIGWSRDQEAEYLQRAFGHPSRSRLTTYADLVAYLTTLEGLQPGQEPPAVPVPLRRRDLLAQSDGLLLQLGWDGERGRQLLEKELGASSRRQLSDSQLLQFNMLLEGALIDTTAGTQAQAAAG